MLVDDVNDGCKDAEPFVICDFTVAQRYWSKDAHVLDEYLEGILVPFEGNLGWLEYVPIVAPDEADQLRGFRKRNNEWMAPVTHSCSKRPDIRRRPPAKIEHCLGAAKYCCSNDVTLLKWVCVWVDHESVATVAKLYLAEAMRCSAIVYKDVVRFDVCRSIKTGTRTRLSNLQNTCVDIATFM